MSVYVNPKKWARVGCDGRGPLSGKDLSKSQARSDDDNQYVKYKLDRLQRTQPFLENYPWQDDPIKLIDVGTIRVESPGQSESEKHVKRNANKKTNFVRPVNKPSH